MSENLLSRMIGADVELVDQVLDLLLDFQTARAQRIQISEDDEWIHYFADEKFTDEELASKTHPRNKDEFLAEAKAVEEKVVEELLSVAGEVFGFGGLEEDHDGAISRMRMKYFPEGVAVR